MTGGTPSPAPTHPADLSREGGWADGLRRVCVWLFAALPALLLVTRVGAEIATAFIGLSFLAVVAARRRWDVLKSPLVAAPIALWLYLMAANAPFAWWDAGAVFGRAATWLRFFCLFAAVVFWLFAGARDFRAVVFGWGAAIAFVLVDGTVQGLFGTSLTGHPIMHGQRLTGPLDRPNVGRFVVFLFFPALAAFLLRAEASLDCRRAAAIALPGIAVLFFTVYTAERAATLLCLLALAVMVSALLVLVPRFRLPGLVSVAAVGAAVIAAIMFLPRLSRRIGPTLGEARNFWNSEYGELARAAIGVWREQPFVGVGLGNFDRVCDAVEPELAFGCLRHPHNIYLEWLAEAGALGLAGFVVFLLFVLVLVLSILRLRAERPLLVAAVLAAPVAALMPFVPSQSFFSNWPALLWWSSLALACAVAFHALHRREG
ncbi:MAG: hypothetical protein RL477_941 [Pseudomonadota bacterium]|jgi:O-antigen ligase